MNRTLTAALACAALLPLTMTACGQTTNAPTGGDAAVTAPEGGGAAATAPSDAAAGAPADGAAAVPPAMPVSQLCASEPKVPDVSTGDFQELEGGVKSKDLVVGTGAEVNVGMSSAINYAGFLEDGTPFDTSCRPGGQPLVTDLTDMIDGWAKGIPGMKVGGRRVLVIPAALGYGSAGYPPVIPPDANLIFDVEIMASQ